MQLCEWANIKRADSDLVGLYFKYFELWECFGLGTYDSKVE